MTSIARSGARGPARVERLTREQAFALAGHLALKLRESERSLESGGLGFELPGTRVVLLAYTEALERLVSSEGHEESGWPFTRMYSALLKGVGPGVASALVDWLQSEADRGGGILESPQGRGWACARILIELERIVGETSRSK